MNIRDALARLDPATDDHWTTDGLPRLDVLRTFLGADASRADVTKAAPEFSRANLALPEAPAAQEAVQESLEEVPLEELQEALSAAVAAREKAALDIVRIQDAIGAAAQKAEAEGTVENPIQAYLAAQNAIAQRRADAREILRENGVNLGELQRSLQSPLDSAMARNKSRGRPDLTPKA